ncbi:MAG: Mur ligase family protein, partial [Akkermansiaceae bacterium]
IVYCAESPVAHEICAGRANTISYGWETTDDQTNYTASDIRDLKDSSAFTVKKNGKPLGDIELAIPGEHNILNALAAIAIADTCGADFSLIARALSSFAGAHGIGGFEWMEGIPGNVGGSLRMNAGAMGIETIAQVVRVPFLDEDGVIRTRERDEIVANYRNVQE